jgi:tryptophan halogenase
VADEMSEAELERFMMGLKQQVDNQVSRLPSHEAFLDKYLAVNS